MLILSPDLTAEALRYIRNPACPGFDYSEQEMKNFETGARRLLAFLRNKGLIDVLYTTPEDRD
jgi:hypothetical protein